MLNPIFLFTVLVSILFAASTGRMQALTDAILQDSRGAVELALKLVGVMAFFLGLMKVAEDAGLLSRVSRAVSPVMRRLFPTVPPDHPAMSAMTLNIASNLLGLANAATPFGIKAMEQLDRLNGKKGTATDAMVLFLVINTSGLALLPSSVIAIRAAAGSADAAGVIWPTWFASAAATLVGVLATLLLARLPRYRASAPPPLEDGGRFPNGPFGDTLSVPKVSPKGPFGKRPLVAWLFVALFLGLLVRHVLSEAGTAPLHVLARGVFSFWVLPAIVAGLLLYGWVQGVRVYDSLVEGAKEGFQVALRIIPFLVAILVAVGMFRASGGLGLLVDWLGPLTDRVGLPAAAVPMAILRPLSGSGALAVMAEVLETHGPDSRIGYMVSTIQGSTETTFYVLAVYFGSVSVKRTRHALPACLLADLAGLAAAVLIVNRLHG